MDPLQLYFISKTAVHYSLHFLIPGLIAYTFFKDNWRKVWLILIATMLVDVDHLLANPIFDPNRCSINFHFLHTYYAIACYALLFIFTKNKTLRIISLGLLLHMFTDYQDCYWW